MISKRCLPALHTMPSTIRMRHRRRTILPYSTMQWIRDSLLAAAWGRTIITAIRYVKYILPPGSCGTRFINILTGMPIYPLYVSGLLYRRLVNRVRRSGMNYWIHGIRSWWQSLSPPWCSPMQGNRNRLWMVCRAGCLHRWIILRALSAVSK